MTTIKPPGTDLPTAPHAPNDTASSQSADQSADSAGASAATGSTSFTQELGRAQQLAGQAPVAGSSGPRDAIAQLSADLEAGKLTMDQALDALVERAVSGVGRSLNPQEREDLLSVLRNAIGSDPTLAALRDTAR